MADQHYDEIYHDMINRSPGLIPSKPDFLPRETPPPLVDVTESEAEEDRRSNQASARAARRRPRTKPDQADHVLIRELDNNRRLDVAEGHLRHALESSSEVDATDDYQQEDDPERKAHTWDHTINGLESVQNGRTVDEAWGTSGMMEASRALGAVTGGAGHFEMVDPPPESPPRIARSFTYSTKSANGHPKRHHQSSRTISDQQRDSRYHVGPLVRIETKLSQNLEASRRAYKELDSIATSPYLAQYTMTPLNANPEDVLPAMQNSPTRPTTGCASDSRTTLPSLKTAIGDISETPTPNYIVSSPTLKRNSTPHVSQYGPSPSSYSHPSPSAPNSATALPSHPAYWRLSRDESSSSSSDHPSTSTAVTTPMSVMTIASPTTNSNSSMDARKSSLQTQSIERSSSPEKHLARFSDSSQPNGVHTNGTNYNPNGHKCTYDGCTAPPFQTPYLLNSHMNVHSEARTHFCPVAGCNRGPGGQGFKRKNEMIRHGLVHTSPGYVCPYCPDQQHRYPRPDNLQRHVRVHHKEKCKDDPTLRDVLAQRPEGISRGRRRRQGS